MKGNKSNNNYSNSAPHSHIYFTTETRPSFSSDNGIALVVQPSIFSSYQHNSIAFMAAHDKSYQVWFLNTGASHHITTNFSLLQEPVQNKSDIQIGSGNMLFSTYREIVRLDVEVGNGKVSTLALSNVLYIPS